MVYTKNIYDDICMSITTIYRPHIDFLTCEHADVYAIPSAGVHYFHYLCVISHVSYMNIPIQYHKSHQGTTI